MNNDLHICQFSVFSVFEIAFQDAQFVIVDVVTSALKCNSKGGCFLYDRVCVIFNLVSAVSTSFPNI